MVKIITFEGSDFVGKTTTAKYLSDKLSERYNVRLNVGPVHINYISLQISHLAKSTDDIHREILYTMGFMLDKCLDINDDSREIIVEDRYWPSVVAYGRFLNGDHSIHNRFDFRQLFIEPATVVYLKCSSEEKIKRADTRKKKSSLDNCFLSSPELALKLEREIERSINGLPNIISLDTTHENIETISSKIEFFLKERGILI